MNNMKRWKNGFSIIEAIIAIMIILGAFLVVISLAAASLRYSTQSRNRIYAQMVAESMLEKIRAHNYGDPEPDFWKMTEISRVTTEGTDRPSVTEFKKTITYKNGSFIGNSDENFDIITIVISWEEGTGEQGQHRSHNLTIQTEVRRNAPNA